MANRSTRKVTREEGTDQLDEIARQMTGGSLDAFTIRETLQAVLSALGRADRRAYLARTPGDKANGYYERGLSVGSIPVEVEVPRTRGTGYRPSFLPPRYSRGYPEESQAILLHLLSSSRSIEAARNALAGLGLPLSERDLDAVAEQVLDEFNLLNTRPIDTDMLVLFMDAKLVEVREGGRLKMTAIYVVIGLGRDGRKQTLACTHEDGRESIEGWRKVLRALIERGLRRVMLIVQDDFPGLLPLVQGLFPKARYQLCTVHMLRNAASHMTREDKAIFKERWDSIANSWDPEKAAADFDQLCEEWRERYPAFMDAIKRKRPYYLTFLEFPSPIRAHLSTTNAVETVNNQIERIRINNGGYFQSSRDLDLKLSLALSRLANGRWAKPAACVRAVLDRLNLLFASQFEEEDLS